MLRFAESKARYPRIFYWNREKSGSDAEVDFVFQKGRHIVPIEVKGGKSGSLKSLHIIMEEKKLKNAIRFDINPPSIVSIEARNHKYQLYSLPIYLGE